MICSPWAVGLWAGSAWSAPAQERLVWVAVDQPGARALVAELGLEFDEGGRGSWRRFRADPQAIAGLAASGLRWRSIEEAAAVDLEGYHDPEALNSAMEALAQQSPSLARLVDLGTSVEGRPIRALQLSATSTPFALHRLMGAHHGDEAPSAELALAVARQLVEAYGLDPEITALLDRSALWVIPAVNPDGLQANTRNNANGIDLNRNYDYEWTPGGTHGEAPFSEPETRAIRTLSAWTPFASGLSLHTGEINFGWVWNYSTTPTPDAPLLEALGERYAAACTDPELWLTDGADWYITYGDANDWSYGRHGSLDFTVELSQDKEPSEEGLTRLLEDHLPAVLAFYEWSDRVGGRVLDAETGHSIPATVRLVEGAQPFETGLDGRFARPVEAGTWTAEISAPGYQTGLWSLGSADPLDTELPLTPSTRVVLRPEPALLSRGAPGTFVIDRESSTLRLTRPGEEAVEVIRTGDGWTVSLDRLSSGPWTIEGDDFVAPRSIFVGEEDAQVQIFSSTLEAEGLRLEGEGFGLGSRAWALSGPDRTWEELPVLEESEEMLLLDPGALSAATGTVDLALVSAGRQLAVLDLLGEPVVDTGEPTPDTGALVDSGGPASEVSGPPGLLTTRGCSAPLPRGSYPHLWALVTVGAALVRRRKR